jgi:SAM-dependent methyltransferase
MNVTNIKNLSYTDFVGFVNQWNVPPGSFVTLSKWINYSKINKDSNILEIACTTGFSLREIAKLTNCQGLGIDISKKSVDSANATKLELLPDANISFETVDATTFESKQKFSHIIIGASIRFFDNPEQIMSHLLTLLEDQGFILSTEFYAKQPIPETTITKAKEVFGIIPTAIPYKEVMKIYKGLDIMYEDKNELVLETDYEIEHYCHSTTKKLCEKNSFDKEQYDAIFFRLKEIKEMSNELRKYQMYNVLVTRYQKQFYPNRFVELF